MIDNQYLIQISNYFFLGILSFTLLKAIFENTLEYLNLNKGNLKEKIISLHKLNPLFKKYYSKAKVQKSLAYEKDLKDFSNFTSSIHGCFGAIVFIFGICPMLIDFLHNTLNLNLYLTYSLCSLGFLYISTLIDIPFSYYFTFNIEEKYHFNTSSKKTFFTDIIKSLIIGSIFYPLILCGLNYILTKYGPFTLKTAPFLIITFTAFSLIFEFLAFPFMKIFNKFTPLKDKTLLKKIKTMFSKQNSNLGQIYVMNASKRSKHSNAFVFGFGKNNKKIVLFDTLLKNYTPGEITSILAHELAHAKNNHILKTRLINLIDLSLSLILTLTMCYSPILYHTFGFSYINNSNILEYSLIGFIISSMIISMIRDLIFSPISNYISRKFEYQADYEGLSYLSKTDKKAMISALIKLHSENLSDAFPHPLYEAFTYDHPSIQNRIKHLK